MQPLKQTTWPKKRQALAQFVGLTLSSSVGWAIKILSETATRICIQCFFFHRFCDLCFFFCECAFNFFLLIVKSKHSRFNVNDVAQAKDLFKIHNHSKWVIVIEWAAVKRQTLKLFMWNNKKNYDFKKIALDFWHKIDLSTNHLQNIIFQTHFILYCMYIVCVMKNHRSELSTVIFLGECRKWFSINWKVGCDSRVRSIRAWIHFNWAREEN